MKSIIGRVMARKRLVIILLIIVGIIFFISRRGNGKSLEQATVGKGKVEQTLTLTGDINAVDDATLQFNSTGKIAWVGVKPGEEVKNGQALMKLDTTKLNATYQKAAADLREQVANVNDIHDQVKGHDSDETFSQTNTRVTAEVAHDKAYESYVSALKDLNDATLTSPFDGIVAVLYNESPGVNVTAGTSQVTVVNPSTIYFLVKADQTEVPDFKVGLKTSIVFDAFEDETVTGTVTSVSPAPDASESGTVYPIRIALDVDNSDYKYKVGMSGDATFILATKEDALYVPTVAVRTSKEGKYVFINNNEDKKSIEIGIEGEDRTEVLSGLSEGETVFY